MTKQLEELATKTDDLSSIFRIYREEGEKKLFITSTCMLQQLYTSTYNITNILKRKLL